MVGHPSTAAGDRGGSFASAAHQKHLTPSLSICANLRAHARMKITLTDPGPVLDCAALMIGGVSVAENVLAAVRVGPSKTEIREYPMPDIPEDAAVMKMEVAR